MFLIRQAIFYEKAYAAALRLLCCDFVHIFFIYFQNTVDMLQRQCYYYVRQRNSNQTKTKKVVLLNHSDCGLLFIVVFNV